jgi:hypothetical protein
MAGARFKLVAEPADRSLIAASMASTSNRSKVVGLDGVLAESLPRSPRVSSADSAVRFRARDRWSRVWWPQGVAVGEHNGTPLAMASWFAQVRHGRSMGSRLTIVDLSDPAHPRYRHVLLVSAHAANGGPAFRPVRIHAGGIAWSGDRMLVSATFQGIREFRLSDIVRVPDRRARPFGYEFLLPESARYTPGKDDDAERMRFSFLSLESATDAAGLQLVTGEYGNHRRGRLARVRVTDDRAVIQETHRPGVARMQGVAIHDGVWYVSASNGDKRRGDLWVGQLNDLSRAVGALPVGPEDLAIWPERRELWTLAEYPGKRGMTSLSIDTLSR